jgi:hypothetical protein
VTLEEFARWSRQAAVITEQNVNQVMRRCALVIDGAVVLATPVDTGRARSNWVVGLNLPPTGTIPAYSPGKGRSTEAANTAAAIAHGNQQIDAFRGMRTTSSIYIGNNLDYIGKLNNGHSKQAPAGFVETAVLQGVNAVGPEWQRLSI